MPLSSLLLKSLLKKQRAPSPPTPKRLTIVTLWWFHFHTVDPGKYINFWFKGLWISYVNLAREMLLCETPPKPPTFLQSKDSSSLLLPIRCKVHACGRSKNGSISEQKYNQTTYGGERKPVLTEHRPGLLNAPPLSVLLLCSWGQNPALCCCLFVCFFKSSQFLFLSAWA